MGIFIEALRIFSCMFASSQRGHQYLESSNVRMREHYHVSPEVSVLSSYCVSSKIISAIYFFKKITFKSKISISR